MEKEYTPKLSVVMSVYNGEEFLHTAIESILNQTFRDFEFIILDDGSKDNSISIIQSYEDNRILLHKLDHQGLPSALNYGISISKGQLICRMDSDDIALSTRFEKQIQLMSKQPEISLCGTSIEIIDEKNNYIGNRIMPSEHSQILETINYSCNVVHPTYCLRKEIHESIGGYRNELLYSQDYDYLLRVIDKGYKVYNIPEILLRYRMINKSTPKKTYNQMRYGLLAQKLHFERIKYGKERKKTLNQLNSLKQPNLFKVFIYKSYNAFNKARINKRFPRALWIFLSFTIAIFDKQIFQLLLGDTRYYFSKKKNLP